MTHATLKTSSDHSNTVQLSISGIRGRFESRIRNSSFGTLADWVLMRNEDGSYKDRQIQHRWDDWQACQAESNVRVNDLQNKLLEALKRNAALQQITTDMQKSRDSVALRQGLNSVKETLTLLSAYERALPPMLPREEPPEQSNSD